MFYYPVVPTWPHPLMNPDSTCQKSFFSISSYEILSFPVIFSENVLACVCIKIVDLFYRIY
jgi:hypothetical protein